jgi:hypothetical protein
MATGVDLFRALILEPLRAAGYQLQAFAPTLIAVLVILLVGGIIARLLETLIVRLLKAAALDKIAEQIKLSSVLVKGGVKRKLSELIGAIVYWIVMLAFVMTALNALNLTVAAELFQKVVAFLPNVIAAVFILIVGVFAAAFLAATVRTAASNAGVVQSHLLGQAVQTIVVIFTIVASLQQLGVPFFGEVFLIVLAGISLGTALAFGLGCREIAGRWVGDLVSQLQSRKR